MRNTVQKSVINEIVQNSCNHPTAEQIYVEAQKKIDKISLGTVYRVLGNLVDDNMVREIAVPGRPSRFDKTTCVHAHFVCKTCGKVEDIVVDADKFLDEAKQIAPQKIDEVDIVFNGICSECK